MGRRSSAARIRQAGAAGTRPVPETLNFANGLLRDRRYESAAEEYERFLQGANPGPDADEARYGLGNARLFQGQYDKARRAFEEFLQGAPNHPNARTAWYRVGEISYLLGDLRAARTARWKPSRPGAPAIVTSRPPGLISATSASGWATCPGPAMPTSRR